MSCSKVHCSLLVNLSQFMNAAFSGSNLKLERINQIELENIFKYKTRYYIYQYVPNIITVYVKCH